MTHLVDQQVGDLPPGVELPSWLDRYPTVVYAAKCTYDTILLRERKYNARPATSTDASGRVWVKPRQRVTASEKIEILKLLATDPRMERVWRELYRKKRGSNEFLNPVRREGLLNGKQLTTLHDPQQQNIAVDAFFHYAWHFAAVRFPLTTQDKILSHFKPYTIMASRLRKNAEGLRALGLDELAADVETVATRCDKRLHVRSHILYPTVKRSRGDAVMRYYVLQMSVLCRRGFGKVLPGVIATTASVALSKNISGDQVREIVRAHDPGANS
jgi:hypothetical protein